MGFPFDRPIPDTDATLETFMTKSQKTHDIGDDKEPVRNMYKTEFKVRYTDKTEYGQTCDEKTCDLPKKVVT